MSNNKGVQEGNLLKLSLLSLSVFTDNQQGAFKVRCTKEYDVSPHARDSLPSPALVCQAVITHILNVALQGHCRDVLLPQPSCVWC